MSTSSAGLSRTTSNLHLPKNRQRDRDISPDRTVVWTEPVRNGHKNCKKVPVVYYISRNGHLEHPHFIEVTLSSPDGLHLQDVINRLNSLRGEGMASQYSWSSKRSYKTGYVWHDLSENDYIHPANGNEYVLKGSELLEDIEPTNSHDTRKYQKEIVKHDGGEAEEESFPATVRLRRHQSWSSFDLHEYKVYKTESTGESCIPRSAANASTQTDDRRRRRREAPIIIEDVDEGETSQTTTELRKHEISPPPSDSSPETLETLMKAENRVQSTQPPLVNHESTPTGKSKAPSVLMQLLSCGAMSFKDCGAGKGDGFSLISHYNRRLPRGGEAEATEKVARNEKEGRRKSGGRRSKGVVVEDKEYFSGSIVEIKKSEFPNLRRSSSYNADR